MTALMLQVPNRTTYTNYDLTAADQYVLNLLLNKDKHYVVTYRENFEVAEQKVAAIKWFRERFSVGLLEAKYAVETFMHGNVTSTSPTYELIGYRARSANYDGVTTMFPVSDFKYESQIDAGKWEAVYKQVD